MAGRVSVHGFAELRDRRTRLGRRRQPHTIGAERGNWDKDGMVQGREKALTLDEMRDILRKEPDFAICQTILERTFETFPLEMQELPWLSVCTALEFSISYLAKFGAHSHG